jgi:flagellar motor switch protein FliG
MGKIKTKNAKFQWCHPTPACRQGRLDAGSKRIFGWIPVFTGMTEKKAGIKRIASRILCLLFVVFLPTSYFIIPTSYSYAAVDISQKVVLERNMEDHLKQVLESVLGEKKVVVMVDAVVNTDVTNIQKESWIVKNEKITIPAQTAKSSEGVKPFEILPGVPLKQDLSQLNKPQSQSQPTIIPGDSNVTKTVQNIIKSPDKLIKKLTATVIVDAKVPATSIKEVEGIALAVLGINPARGDKLVIKKVPFVEKLVAKATLKDTFSTPEVMSSIAKYISLSVAGLIFLGLIALLMRSFLKGLLAIAKEAGSKEINLKLSRADMSMELVNPQGLATGANAINGIYSSSTKALSPAKSNGHPFSFINNGNINKLAYLMKMEKPLTIALILYYIEPDLAAHILLNLNDEMKNEVSLLMATAHQFTSQEVARIEKDLKHRISYLVGGTNKIAEVLNKMDHGDAKNIMNFIADTRPDIMEEIEETVFTFEDLLVLSNEDLQLVLAEVGIQELATALWKTSDKVIEKVKTNLTEGAKAMLNQYLELTSSPGKSKIKSAQFKIIDIIRKLEADEKIIVRKQQKKFVREKRMESKDAFRENIFKRNINSAELKNEIEETELVADEIETEMGENDEIIVENEDETINENVQIAENETENEPVAVMVEKENIDGQISFDDENDNSTFEVGKLMGEN